MLKRTIETEGWREVARLAKVKTKTYYWMHVQPYRGKDLIESGWNKTSTHEINRRLKEHGIHVSGYRVDTTEFQRFRHEHMDSFAHWSNSIEKQLEYYITFKLLSFHKTDVAIDIASSYSPFPSIVRSDVGCTVYHQDMVFAQGVRGEQVGGDATELPFPDSYFSKMFLHCSFEHFEGDADTRFIIEAARVLQDGGKLLIVPLYLRDRYLIMTDPAVCNFDAIRSKIDPDAQVRKIINWGNRFGRQYDVAALCDRVLSQCKDLFDVEIIHIENATDIDDLVYLRFAAIFTRRPRGGV
jgi:hypothetical protein